MSTKSNGEEKGDDIHNNETVQDQVDLIGIEQEESTAKKRSVTSINERRNGGRSSDHEDGDKNKTDEEANNSTKTISEQGANSRNAAVLPKGTVRKSTRSKRPKKTRTIVKKVNSYGFEVVRIVEGLQYRPRAYIWDHYHDVVDEETCPRRRARCVYCGHQVMDAPRMRCHLEYKCHYIPHDIKQEVILLNREYEKSRGAEKTQREILREEGEFSLSEAPRRLATTTNLANYSASTQINSGFVGTSSLVNNCSFGGRVTAATRVLGQQQQPTTSRNPGMLLVDNTTTMLPSSKRRKREKNFQQQQVQAAGYPSPQERQQQPTTKVMPLMDKNTPEWIVSLITSTNSNINSQFASLSTQLNSLSSQLATHTANVESQLVNANARISNLELQLVQYRSSGNNNNNATHSERTLTGSNSNSNENSTERRNEHECDTSSSENDEYYDDEDSDDQDEEDPSY